MGKISYCAPELLLPNSLQTIHPSRSLSQSRDAKSMSKSFAWVRDIIVRDRRMGSDSIIPKGHRLVIPFEADLQILAIRDVLLSLASELSISSYSSLSLGEVEVRRAITHREKQLQKRLTLLLLQSLNSLRKPRIDKQSLLPCHRMYPHNRMFRNNRCSPHMFPISRRSLSLREARMLSSQPFQ